MPKNKEILRQARMVSLGLLTSLGAMGVASNANAAPACDIPAKITNLKRHVIKGIVAPSDSFNATVVRPKERNSIVKVFDRETTATGNAEDDKQFMIDPLTIRCAGKIVRFVGVTAQREHSLGRRHKIANTGLYLDIVRPQDSLMQVFPGSSDNDPNTLDAPLDALVDHNVTVSFDIAQDDYSQNGYPAFVARRAPHHEFGTMINVDALMRK